MRIFKLGKGRLSLQAESTEENHDGDMEQMRDSQGETEEYAYHSGPTDNSLSAST
jgi:hypothetical protein